MARRKRPKKGEAQLAIRTPSRRSPTSCASSRTSCAPGPDPPPRRARGAARPRGPDPPAPRDHAPDGGLRGLRGGRASGYLHPRRRPPGAPPRGVRRPAADHRRVTLVITADPDAWPRRSPPRRGDRPRLRSWSRDSGNASASRGRRRTGREDRRRPLTVTLMGQTYAVSHARPCRAECLVRCWFRAG
jgi:hypothetical protein